ncbi:unnamed protein product [Brachionus calyciflorus]|uniref:Uncharacterized protein n=1 Tax=Brachionus calyciflorus TaxID=104777 RepID=A0A813T4W5_9BILA|nr:unnamed protein product [Brachionus calyciflorus]
MIQDTDEEPGSDNENVEYSVTASRSGEFVQLLEQYVVSEDRIRCDCNPNFKTKRCPCVNDKKIKCTLLCYYIIKKFCEN